MALTQIRNTVLAEEYLSSDPEWWVDAPKIGTKRGDMECVSVGARKSEVGGFIVIRVEWRD